MIIIICQTLFYVLGDPSFQYMIDIIVSYIFQFSLEFFVKVNLYF